MSTDNPGEKMDERHGDPSYEALLPACEARPFNDDDVDDLAEGQREEGEVELRQPRAEVPHEDGVDGAQEHEAQQGQGDA